LLTDQEIRARLASDPELMHQVELLAKRIRNGDERGPGLSGKALSDFLRDAVDRLGDQPPASG
jgi:hypothetical protein